MSFGGQPVAISDELVAVRIGDASMTPVAAPGHPLATYKGRVPLSVVREHIQLVISDVSQMTKGKDFGVFAYRTWRMTDTSTKRDLILSGLGWGGLPTWMILDDVRRGGSPCSISSPTRSGRISCMPSIGPTCRPDRPPAG